MSRALFIRHAETDMTGRYCGHSDPELNAQGRAQLTQLKHLLADDSIETIYSSDLKRAQSTAQALAAPRNIPLVVRPPLREIYFGEWEGMRWEQIEQLDPDFAQEWMAAYPHLPAPAGESVPAFEARVLEEVHCLLARSAGPIAVVTHAGVLRVVLRHLFGCSEQEAWAQTRPYCCVLRYE